MVLSKVKHDYGAYYIQMVHEAEVAEVTDQFYFFNVVQSNEFLIFRLMRAGRYFFFH